MTLPVMINGEWLKGQGAPFSSLNPATGELFWQGNAADDTQVSSAVVAARKASSEWVGVGFDQRVSIARRFAELLGEQKEMFANCIAAETGKPLWEARTEVGAMIGKIEISVKAYNERTGQRSSEVAGTRTVLRHKPHGVVAVFGPYNFPGHLPNGHIAPALIAGNTIVFKPSELTPAVRGKWWSCGWKPAYLKER